MKRDLIHEVFSQIQKGEFIRLAWEDKDEEFKKEAYDNYEQFIAKVNELRSNPHIARSIGPKPSGIKLSRLTSGSPQSSSQLANKD